MNSDGEREVEDGLRVDPDPDVVESDSDEADFRVGWVEEEGGGGDEEEEDEGGEEAGGGCAAAAVVTVVVVVGWEENDDVLVGVIVVGKGLVRDRVVLPGHGSFVSVSYDSGPPRISYTAK